MFWFLSLVVNGGSNRQGHNTHQGLVEHLISWFRYQITYRRVITFLVYWPFSRKTKQNKTKHKTKLNQTMQNKRNKTKQNKTKQNKTKHLFFIYHTRYYYNIILQLFVLLLLLLFTCCNSISELFCYLAISHVLLMYKIWRNKMSNICLNLLSSWILHQDINHLSSLQGAVIGSKWLLLFNAEKETEKTWHAHGKL